MKIGTREVGPGHPTFIIAECGSNHGGSLDAALALIDAAADAGADAAKFQRFRVGQFLVPRPNEKSLRPYQLPNEWLPKLKARCDERGIEFLCTAFDYQSLDVIDPFVAAHKIGHAESGTWEYGWAVRKKNKPLIVSCESPNSWDWASDAPDFAVLRVVGKYPAPIDGYLADRPLSRGGRWGVSDHTLDPLTVPCAAVALGACVVEKHFRLWNYPITPDSPVSIPPKEFRSMTSHIRATERAVRG